MRLLLVCLGGALGSGARYLVAVALARSLGPSFPWATFAVNVVGCFLLQLLITVGAGRLAVPMSDELRLLLTTGVLGGFTTYSSFNAEMLGLVRAGAGRMAVFYLAATVFTCLAAGVAGMVLGRALAGAPAAP